MFGLIALFGAALVFITIPLKQLTQTNDSLADPATLKLLVAGKTITAPVDESDAVFHNTPATPPTLASILSVSRVLGYQTDTTPAEQKRIEVDLTHQKVYAYEGNIKVYEFTISSGKWGRTPTGEFRIWTKVKSQLMKGGDPKLGTYYYLPNVPWVMFFYNDQIPKMRGFSFHGTYWHENFGTPMSHGCINMKSDEAKILYDWASPTVTNDNAWSTPATEEDPGTRVIIYGEAPQG
jgi:lipoprotein-anchoring transpeptidase ErfK/SrfK